MQFCEQACWRLMQSSRSTQYLCTYVLLLLFFLTGTNFFSKNMYISLKLTKMSHNYNEYWYAKCQHVKDMRQNVVFMPKLAQTDFYWWDLSRITKNPNKNSRKNVQINDTFYSKEPSKNTGGKGNAVTAQDVTPPTHQVGKLLPSSGQESKMRVCSGLLMGIFFPNTARESINLYLPMLQRKNICWFVPNKLWYHRDRLSHSHFAHPRSPNWV